MSRRLDHEAERSRLPARLARALATLPVVPSTPTVVVDLDAFDANAADLAARARGVPIRVATKSLRVPALVARAVDSPGLEGLLTYSLREALWLHNAGLSDNLLMGYPCVDAAALRALTDDGAAAASITLMVDDVAHLDAVDAARATDLTVRIAIDVDAGLRLGPAHVGPKRSPLQQPADVVALARAVIDRPGFALVGVMTYEGQVAGVPDEVPRQRARSLVVRRLKSASVRQLHARRAEIATALGPVTDLEFWNAGGSGSIEESSADPVVTEVAAGSGLLVPGLFDHYRSFEPRPAAFFGLPVVRRPGDGCVTVAGGGPHRIGGHRQGPVTAPLGSARPAAHVARGGGRGADPAGRARYVVARHRRPGLVPACEGRRADGARPRGPPRVRGLRRRRRTDVPRDGQRVVSPDASAREIVERTLAAPPTLGAGRLLCIDGPSGSGKTTLANDVLAAVPGSVDVALVHMDDIYPGWDGLAAGVDRVSRLLVAPRALGRPGRYRRYDWHAGQEAEWHDVAPVDLLVIEGVGAGALDYDAQITTLVWVEAPRDVRIDRALARDAALVGLEQPDEHLRAHWLAWSRDEDAHFRQNRTRERADLIVQGNCGPAAG